MRHIFLLASTFACVLTSPAFTAETAAELPTPVVSAGPAQAAPTEAELEAARIERTQRAVLNARMEAVIDASNKTLVGLQAMIDATSDPATLKNLEGRMAQVKRGTTIDLLRVQATFARENGRMAQAEQIDAEIDAILNPTRRATAPRTSPTRVPAEVAPTGGAR